MFDCKRLAPPPPVKLTVSVPVVTEPPLTSLIAEVLELAELSITVEPWSAAARLMPALPFRLTAPVAVNASLKVIDPGPVLAREREPSNCVLPDAVVILPALLTVRLCPEPNDTSCRSVEPLFKVMELPPRPVSEETALTCDSVAAPVLVRSTKRALLVIAPPVVSLMALDAVSVTVAPPRFAPMFIPVPLRLTVPDPDALKALFNVMELELLRIAELETVNGSFKVMVPGLVSERVPNDSTVLEVEVLMLPALVTLRL